MTAKGPTLKDKTSVAKMSFAVGELGKSKTAVGLSEALSKIEGLSEVTVDQRLGRITFRIIRPEGRDNCLRQVMKEVRQAGLKLPFKREMVDIHDMHCAGCVMTLEKGLKNIPGILDARVNFATQVGEVDTIEDLYERDRLLADIKRIGYEASFHIDDAGHHHDNNRLKQNLIISIVSTIPLLFLHMGDHFLHLFAMRGAISATIQLILTLPVLYAGRAFFGDALRRLRHFQTDMNSLIALGSGSAFLYSLAVTLQMFSGKATFASAVYYETTALIITFILLGRFLEKKATQEARDAATGMASLIPQTAARLDRDGNEVQIPVEELRPGDRVVVRPGQSIPADGIILEGDTSTDEAMITGESMPVAKKPADPLTGGTVNISGGIIMRVTRVGSGTVLSRMIRMVREAQSNKAPIQRLADRVAGVFVPIVILIAVATMAVWALIGTRPAAVLVAPIAVLLVACPCALGLATPTAILVGTGRAARLGVLFRDGEVLERFNKIDCFVFDKTGTLTDGKPVVERLLPAEGVRPEHLLQMAASAEQYSEHPFGKAIREKAVRDGIKLFAGENHTIIPGQGITAQIDGEMVTVGRKSFVGAAHVVQEDKQKMTEIEKEENSSVIHVLRDGSYMGAIVLADTLKDGAAHVVSRLLEQGHEVIMLTGDNRFTAAAIAHQLGIKRIEAEVSPETKLATIHSLRRAGFKTAMIGDGVNDAAALAAADVGISLGSGTDIAIKASDITIVGRSLGGILTAQEISTATLRTIKQNLFWAFFYNVIMIPLAAGMIFSPVLAAAAMALSSVFVVTNSLRLRRFSPLSGSASATA